MNPLDAKNCYAAGLDLEKIRAQMRAITRVIDAVSGVRVSLNLGRSEDAFLLEAVGTEGGARTVEGALATIDFQRMAIVEHAIQIENTLRLVGDKLMGTHKGFCPLDAIADACRTLPCLVSPVFSAYLPNGDSQLLQTWVSLNNLDRGINAVNKATAKLRAELPEVEVMGIEKPFGLVKYLTELRPAVRALAKRFRHISLAASGREPKRIRLDRAMIGAHHQLPQLMMAAAAENFIQLTNAASRQLFMQTGQTRPAEAPAPETALVPVGVKALVPVKASVPEEVPLPEKAPIAEEAPIPVKPRALTTASG